MKATDHELQKHDKFTRYRHRTPALPHPGPPALWRGSIRCVRATASTRDLSNLIIFDNVHFSTDSTPFTMYLNFDKTVVGIFIYLFLLKKHDSVSWQTKDSLITIRTFAGLLAFMLPLALATHYVRIDPKLPSHTWLWALNNLFFVSFAEESLFRGLIQGGLTNLASTISHWKWPPLVVSS